MEIKTPAMLKIPIPVWEWSDVFIEISNKYPHRVEDFAQSFSENQFAAKTWLIDQLKVLPIAGQKNLTVVIMGSWYATLLVPLLLQNIKGIRKIIMIDYDEETLELAKFVHRSYPQHLFEYQCKDLNFDYEKIESDIIINCSCEHMYHMKDFVLKGLCVFQSNNFRKESAHINCVDDVEEFVKQTGVTSVIYKGERQFHRWDDFHKRFMVIGQR